MKKWSDRLVNFIGLNILALIAVYMILNWIYIGEKADEFAADFIVGWVWFISGMALLAAGIGIYNVITKK